MLLFNLFSSFFFSFNQSKMKAVGGATSSAENMHGAQRTPMRPAGDMPLAHFPKGNFDPTSVKWKSYLC